MMNEVISGKQLRNMMTMFILGSSIITSGAIYTLHCGWISEIIAITVAIPFLLMYSRMATIHKDKNMYEIYYESLGKTTGFIFSLLFILYSLWLASAVLRNFTEFVYVVFFPETPQYITALFTGVIILYALNKGIEVVARGVSLVLPLIIALTITTVLLSVKDMDFTNILPFLHDEPKSIFKEVFALLTFPYLEVIMFTTITPNLSKNDKPYKAYLYSSFIGGATLVFIFFRNLFVLGAHALKTLYFPAYSAISLINVSEFISRVEVVAAANYVFCVVLKVTICLYSACKGLSKICKVDDYKVFITPSVLFTIYFSGVVFKNTIEMSENTKKNAYIAIFIQVVIPLLTYIITEIKYRTNKRRVQVQQA